MRWVAILGLLVAAAVAALSCYRLYSGGQLAVRVPLPLPVPGAGQATGRPGVPEPASGLQPGSLESQAPPPPPGPEYSGKGTGVVREPPSGIDCTRGVACPILTVPEAKLPSDPAAP
jgi:hypothetical protein